MKAAARKRAVLERNHLKIQAKANQRAGGGDRKSKNRKSGSSELKEPIDAWQQASKEAGVAARVNGYVLPPRLRQVADLLVLEFTDAAVAAELHISARTVGFHVRRLQRALGASSRIGCAVRWDRFVTRRTPVNSDS